MSFGIQHKYDPLPHIKRSEIKFKHRFDPVPYVRKRKNGYYFRQFKTKQERTVACLHDIEGIKFRRKRNHKNIPNSWDDIKKTRIRNWKKYRKTRWK